MPRVSVLLSCESFSLSLSKPHGPSFPHGLFHPLHWKHFYFFLPGVLLSVACAWGWSFGKHCWSPGLSAQLSQNSFQLATLVESDRHQVMAWERVSLSWDDLSSLSLLDILGEEGRGCLSVCLFVCQRGGRTGVTTQGYRAPCKAGHGSVRQSSDTPTEVTLCKFSKVRSPSVI